MKGVVSGWNPDDSITPSILKMKEREREREILQDLIPHEAPKEAEPFEKVLEDFERLIMPGVGYSISMGSRISEISEKTMFQVTHWQHPRFHAYFPAGERYYKNSESRMR